MTVTKIKAIAASTAIVGKQGSADPPSKVVRYWNLDLLSEFAGDGHLKWHGVLGGIAGESMRKILREALFFVAEPIVERSGGSGERRDDTPTIETGKLRAFASVRYVADFDKSGKVRGFVAFSCDSSGPNGSYRQLRESMRRVLSRQEGDKRSLANILHEDIAQHLFAVQVGLDSLQKSLTGNNSTLFCREVAEQVRECLMTARNIANALFPLSLAHLPLVELIQEHACYALCIPGVKIAVSEDHKWPPISIDVAVVFYRAIQEALGNVARHARAHNVTIVFGGSVDLLVLSVIDDGVGFTKDSLHKAGSFGLLLISERLKQFEARMSMHNNVMGGTTLRITAAVVDVMRVGVKQRGAVTGSEVVFAK